MSNDALVRGVSVPISGATLIGSQEELVLIHYATEFITPPTCAEHNARRAGNIITYPQFQSRSPPGGGATRRREPGSGREIRASA
jgi:hypothetical protein